MGRWGRWGRWGPLNASSHMSAQTFRAIWLERVRCDEVGPRGAVDEGNTSRRCSSTRHTASTSCSTSSSANRGFATGRRRRWLWPTRRREGVVIRGEGIAVAHVRICTIYLLNLISLKELLGIAEWRARMECAAILSILCASVPVILSHCFLNFVGLVLGTVINIMVFTARGVERNSASRATS